MNKSFGLILNPKSLHIPYQKLVLLEKVLFYYLGSEHFGVQPLIAYLESKGHETELIYDPALGDNGYLDIPVVNNFLNKILDFHDENFGKIQKFRNPTNFDEL